MGLIVGLLTLPLAPVRGTAWVAEKILEQAENELYDENVILRQFMELEMDRDAGVIDEAEAEEIEEHLFERLMTAREMAAQRALMAEEKQTKRGGQAKASSSGSGRKRSSASGDGRKRPSSSAEGRKRSSARRNGRPNAAKVAEPPGAQSPS